MAKETVRTAITDWEWNNKLLSVVQSTSDPTKYGLVICNPDGSPIGWGITDGDKWDITVSGWGTNRQIDAGVIGTAELSWWVNASLALANSASQPWHTHVLSEITPDIDYDMADFSITMMSSNTRGYTSQARIDYTMSSDVSVFDTAVESWTWHEVGTIFFYPDSDFNLFSVRQFPRDNADLYIHNAWHRWLTIVHDDWSWPSRFILPYNANIKLEEGEGLHFRHHSERAWWCLLDQFAIKELNAGANITIDNTNPYIPIISATWWWGWLTYTAISANTTLSADNLYDVTCSTADIILTLPALTANDTLDVRKADNTKYAVIINAPSIMWGTSISLTTQDESVTLFYTGTTFIIK